jgi:Obg family GTPase CgtA-like protein
VLTPATLDGGSGVEKRGGEFVVTSRNAIRVAAMVDQANWSAIAQFRDLMGRMGLLRALERAGVSPGDMVKVGKVEWEWE